MRTSKRAMKATLISVLLLGATVLGTSSSQGQSGKPLTPEQASAKAAFDEAIASDVKGMKDDCGIDLVVTTDFENYDRSTYANSGRKGDDGGGKGGGDKGGGGAKKKEGDSSPEDWKRDQRNPAGPLRVHRSTCSEAIEALSRLCPKKRSASSTIQLPAVKGIACLMGGLQPAQENDRMDDKVQRNMSFSNGVFTVRIPPYGMPNVSDNVFKALTPVSATTDRMNGIQCAKATDCRSGVCSKSVCTACGPQAACSGATETCGKSGVCFHKDTPEEARDREARDQARADERESNSGSSKSGSTAAKPKGSEKGRMCGKGTDCQSGVCKMENRTRGKCQ